MNVDHDKTRALGELRRALQVLASPGDVALSTMPAGSVKADEIALEFSDALGVAATFADELGREQWFALQNIDHLLDEMSGEENTKLWTDGAVVDHPRWQAVRSAADLAMHLIDWSFLAGRNTG